MKNKYTIILCALVGTLSSCNEYDFNQEQYKNDISLLSNSNLVYDRQVASVEKDQDMIYLVAAVSGSQPSNQAYNVALLKSDSLLKAYNKSNFDIEEARFAKLLPEECYEFPNMEMQIPTGASKVEFPVQLKKLDKISPDSIYFLNYRIDESKTPNCNQKKKHVLLQIFKQNYYSTTKTATYYNYTNTTIVIPNPNGSPEVRRPTSANRVFPMGANSVRMMAGDEDFGDYKSALDKINTKSIILEMGAQLPENPLARSVTIKPYEGYQATKKIDVVQLTPINEYDNTFLLNAIRTPDGRATYYKEFRLHYKYRLNSTDVYREVNAVLRLDYNPRTDNL